MRWTFVVVVVGCHGGGAQQPDASLPIDVAIDAADPFVRVHYHAADLSGYEVLFYTPDNQLVARTSPDATGVAAAMLPTGGTVVAVRDPVTNSIDEVRAIFGVEPGDDIDAVAQSVVAATDSMTITVPDEPGTSAYRLGSRCGSGGSTTTTIQLFLVPDCTGPIGVLAHATDAANHAFAAQRGSAIATDQGTGALTGAWLPLDTVTVVVTAADAALGAAAQLFPIVDATPLDGLDTDATLSLAANASGAMTFAVAPNGIVDARLVRLSFGNPMFPTAGQTHERVLAPTDTAPSFDAVTDELPWYDANDVNSFDPATRTITLVRSPGGIALDGQIIRLEFRIEDAPPRAWNIVLPPDQLAVTLPVLPADFAALDPSDPLVMVHLVGPTGITASSYAGYDDLRRGAPISTAIGSFYNITTIPISSL